VDVVVMDIKAEEVDNESVLLIDELVVVGDTDDDVVVDAVEVELATVEIMEMLEGPEDVVDTVEVTELMDVVLLVMSDVSESEVIVLEELAVEDVLLVDKAPLLVVITNVDEGIELELKLELELDVTALDDEMEAVTDVVESIELGSIREFVLEVVYV